MKPWLLLLTLVALTGCQRVPLGHRYDVLVDPAFTEDEQGAFLAAQDSWTRAIPGLYLNVQVGLCSGVHDGQICSHRTDHAGLPTGNGSNPDQSATTHNYHDPGDTIDGGDMYFDMTAIQSDAVQDHQTYLYELQHIFAHETGHAMGLVHHTPPSGQLFLMGPYTDQQPLGPAQDDIEQWESLR